jgi:hypothetical protein
MCSYNHANICLDLISFRKTHFVCKSLKNFGEIFSQILVILGVAEFFYTEIDYPGDELSVITYVVH